MATKVVHGAHPRFGVPLGRGWYRITITGHYTLINGLTVAGVTRARWNSTRKSKQRGELLGLRTAFLHFYMREWLRTGGTGALPAKTSQKAPPRVSVSVTASSCTGRDGSEVG